MLEWVKLPSLAHNKEKDGTMSEQKVTDYKNYIGDVNLECGGTFFDLSDVQYGYVTFLEVTDLDSACGETDCVLVEFGTVGIDDDEINARALRCVGQTLKDLDGDKHRAIKLAYANMAYGQTRDLDSYVQSLLIWAPFDPTDLAENRPDAAAWHAKFVMLESDDVFSYLLREGYLTEFS